jgi:hypothetical protein
MSYDIFRHKYAAWLRLTPKVHTLSPVDPLRRSYSQLGRDIHSIPQKTLEKYLESYYMELHDESVA